MWSNLHNPFWFVLTVLATARLTSILYEEEIARPIREMIGINDLDGSHPDTFLGRLFDCYWCLSVWCSLPTIALWIWFPYGLLPFAISMGAITILVLLRK